jgi:hypothetical protein
MIFLDLINDVLIRLREDTVESVNQNSYSRLIGRFVNDAKRQVEDAYIWNALRQTYVINTQPNVFSYTLTNSGVRFKLEDVINDTEDFNMHLVNTEGMNKLFLTQFQTGVPRYFNFNGVNSNGDTQVDIYPVPDKVYNLKFNVIQPQPTLIENSDRLLVASEPVIFYAYAKALAERGEDGGIQSSEAYQLYLQSLADHISIESSRNGPDFIWEQV